MNLNKFLHFFIVLRTVNLISLPFELKKFGVEECYLSDSLSGITRLPNLQNLSLSHVVVQRGEFNMEEVTFENLKFLTLDKEEEEESVELLGIVAVAAGTWAKLKEWVFCDSKDSGIGDGISVEGVGMVVDFKVSSLELSLLRAGLLRSRLVPLLIVEATILPVRLVWVTLFYREVILTDIHYVRYHSVPHLVPLRRKPHIGERYHTLAREYNLAE
ncbi:hypothetical protein T459_14838 [Capsicum annuum]|uniref:Uncharacterized protein n=1 Tax=Capsicum annuum TaxID=4072 RepID=A0A2G2ZIM3_CAPAN|nr:hypothetical protein T459_14838 [Capsicum annuum]